VTGYELTPWEELAAPGGIQWNQGEHVTIIGPTGYGKTTVELLLLPRRAYTVFLATKPRDRVLSGLVRSGEFYKTETWPPPGPADLFPKVMLWPKWTGPADTAAVAETFYEALSAVFVEGSWCVAADELAWLCRRYGLADTFRDLWQQGRSNDLSLLCCVQRPAWVPLDAYTESTHLFLFKQTETEALKRIQGLGGMDPVRVRNLVRRLRKYEFVYINKATEQLVVSRTPG
jgi:hypothetical protein